MHSLYSFSTLTQESIQIKVKDTVRAGMILELFDVFCPTTHHEDVTFFELRNLYNLEPPIKVKEINI